MLRKTRPDRRSRKDTRGLPSDLDPRWFYEYRYMERSKEASGIEGLVLKYIPYTIVRSFAVALDPYYQFKVAPGRISPRNRTTTRIHQNVFDKQELRRTVMVNSANATPNYDNIPGRWGPVRTSSSSSVLGTYSSKMPVLKMSRRDSTSKTRLIGSRQGEFEKFEFRLNAPVNRTRRTNTERRHLPVSPYGGVFPEIRDSNTTYLTTVQPGAWVSQSTCNVVEALEKSYAAELIQKHSLPMYTALNPQFRTFSFFRELAELKDLPRTIISLRDTVRDMSRVASSIQNRSVRDSVFSLHSSTRDIPKEYLSYHFGWKLLVKSLNDLLVKPEQTAKRISTLIKRSGQPTTYRLRRVIPSVVSSGLPNLNVTYYDPSESLEKTETRLERQSEIRLVVNTTFDFPPLNRVNLAKRMLYDQLGLYPRPTDFYNLVPWSWLFDWFTGVGDYVSVIDEINRDRSLINWGMISVVTKGKLTTTATSRFLEHDTVQVTYADTGTTTSRTVRRTYTANLEFSYHLRQDLASLKGVRRITDPDSLSPYQKSILGALLSERTRARR